MEIYDQKIISLKAKVKAATEEFDAAISFHETWKPAAYDADLHARIGRSRSAHAFIVVRQALRREMLLALVRLWDHDSKAVGMESIANTLEDKRVMNILAQECESHWGGTAIVNLDDIPESERPLVRDAVRRSEQQFGRKQSDKLRVKATEAISIIRRYAEEGPDYSILKGLRELRNQRLAHRQVSNNQIEILQADSFDETIETFYQQMSKLIRLLRGCVEGVDYQPEDTAKLRQKHATLFWAGVRGENTEGHPMFRKSRRSD